jgi:tRNA1Val (adenine37-N6)-methyltransferase
MREGEGADETLDLLCGEELKIVQKREGYRFSIDPILLANFVVLKKGERLLDIGTGCGIIPIYMSKKGFPNPMLGIELQSDLFGLALKNSELNHCENITFLHGDIRVETSRLKKTRIDVIVSNPPYTRKHSGRKSPDDSRHIARYESCLDLSELLLAASSLLSRKGRFYAIYPTKRLGEIIYSAKTDRLELKRIRLIHPKEGERANLFIAEFLKDGGIGTIVDKPLYVYRNGDYSEEVKSYYSLKG